MHLILVADNREQFKEDYQNKSSSTEKYTFLVELLYLLKFYQKTT